MTGPADAKQKDGVASESSHSFIKKHRLWEIATFFFVMFLSPASFVFGLFLGISPEAWLTAYLKYVVVFITLAFFIALGGLEVATSYWLKAERVKTGRAEGEP